MLIELNISEKFMNKLQVILGTAVLSTALVGCANVDQINAKVDALETKVEALTSDVNTLKSQQAQLANDVAAAKAEANRANERLDNLATKYKK